MSIWSDEVTYSPFGIRYAVLVDGKRVDSHFFDVGGYYNILIDDTVSSGC